MFLKQRSIERWETCINISVNIYSDIYNFFTVYLCSLYVRQFRWTRISSNQNDGQVTYSQRWFSETRLPLAGRWWSSGSIWRCRHEFPSLWRYGRRTDQSWYHHRNTRCRLLPGLPRSVLYYPRQVFPHGKHEAIVWLCIEFANSRRPGQPFPFSARCLSSDSVLTLKAD